MAKITITNLTFCYEGSYENIFENVSLQLDTNWRLGLTGRNGRGKTTLLRLLAGQLDAHGAICAPMGIDYFPFPVADRSLYAVDAVANAAPGVEQWRLQRELNLLEFPEDALWRPFEALSGGEQTKLLLAALFAQEDRYLLIDEPTNHLDIEARRAVSRYLASKQGFLLVSHDRAFLDGAIDHILSINKMNMELQKGNFRSWQENFERQQQREAAENDRLKKDIHRLKEAARQAAGWSDALEKTKKGTRIAGLRPDRGHIGAKAAKMMKRSKIIEARRDAAADEKSKLLRNLEETDELRLRPLAHHAQPLLDFSGTVCYGGEPVSVPVSFAVRSSEVVALSGRNGCGKSSILKYIAGAPLSLDGTLHTAGGLKISYVPQDTAALCGTLRALAAERKIDETRFFTFLRKLGFARTQFEKRMEEFSEGQKKKVFLAASLCESAHLYLWDEPLNFIDVDSRIQIEALIRESKPAMLLVEHDESFLSQTAAEIITVIRNHDRQED